MSSTLYENSASLQEVLDTVNELPVSGGLTADDITEALGYFPADSIDLENVSDRVDGLTMEVSAIPENYVANSELSSHNTSNASHNDIRLLISGLTSRLDALANSDDTTLDQLSEIVAYIKANKSLIEGITTSKVNVADIVNNLTSNVTNKPLSAAQGVALKTLIDAIIIPTTLPASDVYAWAKAATKPTYTKTEVGLGNVDNVKQYSASNPPPYPVTTVNGKTGAVSLSASDVGAASKETVDQLSETVTNQQTTLANSVLFTAQTLTEAQKAQARENIGASAGEDIEAADSVEWLNENGDTSKKYVLPDGYIYAYTEKYVEEAHDANNENAKINIRPSTGVADGNNQQTQNGVFLSDKITFSTDWTESGETVRALSTVTIGGLEKVVPAYNNSSVIVYVYKHDGTYITAWRTTDMESLGKPALGTELTLPISIMLKDKNAQGIASWANVGYARILLGISTTGAITADDVANLSINCAYYDFSGTVSGWFSTGQQHSNDKATQQNSADIAALKERTETLETDVAELKNGNLVNIQTGQVLYAVGDSITYGYGIGGNDYSWVKHVIDRNGYDAENSVNLGQSGLGFCSTSTSGNTINDVVGGTNFSGADIVTVALGINDWKNANATLTDFWVGMEYCFNKIRTDNPYCKIFYILPFNARFLGSFDTFWCLGAKGDSNTARPYAYTLQTFINMIKAKFDEDTFKAFHVHVIDMVECPAINRYNVTSSDTLIDSTHPSAACNVELGKEIARRIALT